LRCRLASGVKQDSGNRVPPTACPGSAIVIAGCGIYVGNVAVEVALELADVRTQVGPDPMRGKGVPIGALDLDDHSVVFGGVGDDVQVYPPAADACQRDLVLRVGRGASQSDEKRGLDQSVEAASAA
jgi:hypothetical protein